MVSVVPMAADNAPINVRLFASLREQAGWSERPWFPADGPRALTQPLKQPITPRRLWSELQLPGELGDVRVAINQQFASADAVLQSGDELAFLPPISGG